MIKCENGNCKIKGSKLDIMAETTCVMSAFVNLFRRELPKDDVRGMLNEMVDMALLKEDDLEKKAKEKEELLKTIESKIDEFIDDLLKDLKGEVDE